MKFLIILTILIVGLLNLVQSDSVYGTYISARVYCSHLCVGNYKTIEINTGECTLLPSDKTCGYALPYLTTTPVTTFPQVNYSVTASVGCPLFPIFQQTVALGVCNSFSISGVPYSILASQPIEGTASNSSSHIVSSSFVLLSLIVSLFAFLL